MVGEIRDTDTAKIATEAALTGHLVLSTLHTNDSPGAIARLVEMEVEPFLVASALCGVLAQRLVRRICQRCREAYDPPKEALDLIGLSPQDADGVAFYKARGCDHCFDGYRGRVGVYELLLVSDAMRDMILHNAPAHEMGTQAVKLGMVTLQQDARAKVLQGLTTIEEAYRHTQAE
jgi:type II secretory ATPase GspE/PulE/Tfp pilus assembly ATPase PilB-like protein